MSIKSLIRGKKNSVADKKPDANGAKKPVALAADAVIDFPKEGQEVQAGHYAVRVSARPGFDVEINTGGADWFPCREAVGFFWFDWWPAKPGRTTLALRVKVGKGRWKKVSERSCRVAAGVSN
jgi:hypothetical protein